MKKTALEIGVMYIVTLAAVGASIGITEMTGGAVNYAALPSAMVILHVAVAAVGIMLVLVKTAWRLGKDFQQRKRREAPIGTECA